MYTLYSMLGSCSMAVHVLLNEVQAPVTLKNVAGPTRPAEYLEINPRGSVPTLVDGDFVLREGAAILITLAEKHGSPLLPASGRDRARALEWLAFANATMHPAYSRAFFMHRHLGEDAKNNPLYDAVIASIQGLWNDVESTLQTQEYVCGKSCKVKMVIINIPLLTNLVAQYPNSALTRYKKIVGFIYENCQQQPCYTFTFLL